MKGYNSNLASEFYVLSVLYRKGFDASLTLGNKKSVDIIAFNRDGKLVTIDVKGIIGKTMFPVDNVNLEEENPNHYLVFIAYQNSFYDERITPIAFILPIKELKKIIYINPKQTRKGVTLKSLRENCKFFENRWEILRSYGIGYSYNTLFTKEKWIEFLTIYNGLREQLLSFDYYTQTIPFEEFIKICLTVKKEYPINLEKVIRDYCEDFHIMTTSRIKESIEEICSDNIDNISSVFDSIMENKRNTGEIELNSDNSVQRLGNPIPPSVKNFLTQEKQYIDKRKEKKKNDKLKYGA